MNKDTKKTDMVTQINSVTMSNLLTEGYQLLISHAGYSSRKILAENLDKGFIPKLGFIGWKNRFLYPERNIPKKHYQFISLMMLEEILIQLQKQNDFILSEINSLDDIINKSRAKIKELKTLTSKANKYIEKNGIKN